MSLRFSLLAAFLLAGCPAKDEKPTDSVEVDDDADGYDAGVDCHDGNSEVHPGANEFCNGVDDDCDGVVDPDGGVVDGATWYSDGDGDGYGDGVQSTIACAAPADYVSDGTDCNDQSDVVYPGAPEGCNRVDDDCDGETDENEAVDAATWYEDADGDGFGNPNFSARSCDPPSGYVAESGDCDDGADAIFPGAIETCDGLDDDCDGETDEDDSADAPTWYEDADGDGYGDATRPLTSCEAPAGAVAGGADCDDDSATVSPGRTESCDGVDDDCDGVIDEDDAVDTSTWYRDADGDGYGDVGTITSACTEPSGYVPDATDCDDTTPATSPASAEVCNDADDDCNGVVDDTADADADGEYACTDPDDTDARIYTGAAEVCDGVDNDLDGFSDADGPTTSTTSTFGDTITHGSRTDGTHGNYYLATENARIEEIQMYGQMVLYGSAVTWSVYEATSLRGSYSLIASVSGDDFESNSYTSWASSGAIAADIVAGRYYYVSSTFEQSASFYYDPSPDFSEASGLVPEAYSSGSAGLGSVSTTALYAQIVTVGADSDNADEDGDGVSVFCGDCNDADDAVSPGITEVCGDGVDQDCDGTDCP